ncbi:cation efflux system protein, putative [Acidobacterium capsulatum ATCC 51196]|uniref:Cation efflux system protein, putative n=2 Tax=Acidobacteriaceae TaxID=204434 RepID=C1F4I8_ACIC5|nr:cation efflux system protein, putative [Acidobacterium capsulatum ATCC 51196]
MLQSPKRKAKRIPWMALAALPLLAAGAAAHAQISLYTATDLALRNSPEVRIGVADVQRAAASVSESKDAYIPSFVFGSNLGYSYGFPVGQPSIYSVSTQSLVLSFSQRDYIRSAHQGLLSAEEALKSKRDKVLNEAATDYVELNIDTEKIAALQEEKSYTQALVGIEQDRVKAGVDPRLNLLQAELTSAQIDLNRIHTEQDAAQMRTQLANLTGLPAVNFQTVSSSIPPMPEFSSSTAMDAQLSAANADVDAARADAQSKLYKSLGDHRKNLRPLLSFGAQYSRYARFNNYAEYYQHFQSNNFDIGVGITIPLFDATARAQARESAAEAMHAKALAEQTQQLMEENMSQLRGSVLELNAEQRVARLQSEITQAQLQTVEQELQNGSGQPGGQPITPQQGEQAHIQERARYIDQLDASLKLVRAQLSLMQLTGSIDGWIHSATQH